MNFFLNKKVGILGLSRTGISSIKFLKKKGFDVFGWDDNKEILSKAKKNRLNIKKSDLGIGMFYVSISNKNQKEIIKLIIR